MMEAWDSLVGAYKNYSVRLGDNRSLKELFPNPPDFNPLDPKNFDKLASHLLKLKNKNKNLQPAAQLRQQHFEVCIKGKGEEDEGHRHARNVFNEAAEKTQYEIDQLECIKNDHFDRLSQETGKSAVDSCTGAFEYVSLQPPSKKKKSKRKKKKKGKKKKKNTQPLPPSIPVTPKEHSMEQHIARIAYIDELMQRYYQTNQVLSMLQPTELDAANIMYYVNQEMFAFTFDPVYYHNHEIIRLEDKTYENDVWTDDWAKGHMENVRESIQFYKDMWEKNVELERICCDQEITPLSKRALELEKDGKGEYIKAYYLMSCIVKWSLYMKERNITYRATGLYNRHGLIMTREKFIDRKYMFTHNQFDTEIGPFHFGENLYGNCNLPSLIYDICLYSMVEYVAITKKGFIISYADVMKQSMGVVIPGTADLTKIIMFFKDDDRLGGTRMINKIVTAYGRRELARKRVIHASIILDEIHNYQEVYKR